MNRIICRHLKSLENPSFQVFPVPTGLDADRGDVRLALGWRHGFVYGPGAVYGWGDNRSGQLGLYGGKEMTNEAGAPVTPVHCSTFPVRPGGDVQLDRVVCGRSHTLALLTDGSLHALGDSSLGQTGTGTHQSAVPIPTKLDLPGLEPQAAPPSQVSSVAAGYDHCLAHCQSTGQLFSWGFNSEGQLGREPGPEEARGAGARVAGLGGDGGLVCPSPGLVTALNAFDIGVARVFAGPDSSAALLADGRLVCWGAAAGGADRAVVAVAPEPGEQVADACFVGDYLVVILDNVESDFSSLQSKQSVVIALQGDRNGPFVVQRAAPLPDTQRAVQLACSQLTALVLTDHGHVLEWHAPPPDQFAVDADPVFYPVSFGDSLIKGMASGPVTTAFFI